MKKAIFRGSLKRLKNLITFLFFGTFSVTAVPASFDCNIALSNVEKMICANQELSEADEKLGVAYKRALAISTNAQSLKGEQKAWLRTKRNLCSDIPCMIEVYRNRLNDFEMLLSDKTVNVVPPLKYKSVSESANTTTSTEKKTNFSFWQITLMIIIGAWFLKIANRAIKRAAKRHKQEQAENAARLAQEEYQRTQNAIARARALSNIAELVSDSQLSAAKIPLILSDAELCLDQAENEFSEGLYSPFWEAMEGAVQNLGQFDKTLRSIESAQQRYAIEAPPLAPDVVNFSLGVTLLPDPSPTNLRVKALYRQAQKDPHFAQIYEQRRTNAILIEGFRSLGDALTYLGDRIESELRSLSDHLDFRLSDLESALRNSSEQMEKQHEALLQTAQSWREEAHSGNAELIAIARSNADQAEKSAKERREYETTTQNMLDNIQRRRKPLWPEIGGDDY